MLIHNQLEVHCQVRTSTIASKWLKVGVAVFWIGVWEIGYLIVGKEVLLPSPLHTLQTLMKMAQQQSFYLHIIFTLYRIMAGVLISFLVALVTAALCLKKPIFGSFLRPAIQFMKATPVMAIIILALLWFKSDDVPIFVCFLMCYPIIYTNIVAGILRMDKGLEEMSKLYHVSISYRIRKCYLPQLRSYLQAALDLGIGMGFKVVIAAEVLSIPKYAMGYELLDAKIYLETQEVFAWVLVIVLLSQLLSHGINMLFKMRKIK